MASVVLIIHLIIALALVGLVLLQRSEGGALGIGGGGGGGGLFSGRGAANVLTRATAVLAAVFFMTSILFAILARQDRAPTSVFEGVTPTTSGEQPAGDAPANTQLPQLPARTPQPAEPQAPVSE
ncbi:MAG: preprotein translocase subunit SecG [Hyphomicrobiales bacterium]